MFYLVSLARILPNEAVLHVYLAHRAFYLTKPRFVFYLASSARIYSRMARTRTKKGYRPRYPL